MSRTAFLFFVAAASLALTGSATAQSAPYPYIEGFEGLELASHWTAGGSPQPAVVGVSGSYLAYEGTQQLVLGSTAVDGPGSATADLMIDLSGQNGVRLHFAHRIDGGSFGGSGIYLSDDGLNFYYVKVLDNFVSGSEYLEHSLDLDKLASEFGLVFNDHFVIRFEYDGWGSNSRALYDAVRVVPTNFSLLQNLKSAAPTGLGYFGQSVAGISDINGDGVGDIAVGHPGYSLKRGRVEYWSGKNGTYLGAVQKGFFSERFGESIANVGDQDGDGFDELLVGAPGNDIGFADSGAAYLVNSKTGQFLAELHGLSTSEAFGAVVAGIPDWNGDGKMELVVAAPQAGSALENAGRVNVFSSIDFASQLSYEGTQAGEQLGSALGWVGDLDGDGLVELLLGSPGFDATAVGSNEGALFVRSSALSEPLAFYLGTEIGAAFGSSATGLDDIDQDGVPDLAVGIPGANGGFGSAQILSGNSGVVLHRIDGDKAGDQLGATVHAAGQLDGFGGTDLAVGTTGEARGYVRLIGLPSFTEIGFVDVVEDGIQFGAAVASVGDLNQDGLDDIAIGAPNEVLNGQQGSGTVRLATLAKGPQVLSVEGVHSTLSGEVVLHGVNMLAGTKVVLDGEEIPSIQVSVSEIRVPVGVSEPGGFQSLSVSSALGISAFPGGLPRYPALECDSTLAMGAELNLRLAGGEPGLYILAFSNKLFAAPAPFTAFGWYHGLELNGVWIASAGVFTPEYTTAEFSIPGTTAEFLIGHDFYLQAWTSQSILGLAGFSNRVTTTLVP